MSQSTHQAQPLPAVPDVNPPGRRLPELLAPAGDWACARAAVENGADAIYFGLEKFNARLRAHNFTEADLPSLMEFLHQRQVRGYVTFNTLVFQNELADAEQYLRSIIAAGVDAAIVQDIGICRLIRRLSPDFPIHASTQMTVTSATGVAFAQELGCSLVVLARECSLKEIGAIQQAQAGPTALPLEVFVHGALCVAYSGQCLTSEALGGRSANRGECAQACRMPYELICDGQQVPLGDRKYLLSPQDLAGLEVLPGLVQSGVASLKIEGRLKSPEYVANITRVYRQALDRLRDISQPASTSVGRPSPGAPALATAAGPVSRDEQYDMEMAFSRGLSTGWFRGINNQQLVHARFGKKRGTYLGEVTQVRHDGIILQPEQAIKPGDGVVFDAGHPEQPEQGGRVYHVIPSADFDGPAAGSRSRATPRHRSLLLLRFGKDDVDLRKVHPGDKVWKTSDPELERRLRQTFAGSQPRFRRPVHFEVYGHAGGPLTLIARDEVGHVVQLDSTLPLETATKHPLTEAVLQAQLGRLGGTPFVLGHLQSRLEGDVILPVSELNRLRRETVSQLLHRRALPPRWTLTEESLSSWALAAARPSAPHPPAPNTPRKVGLAPDKLGAGPRLIVLIRNLSQLDALLQSGVETVYCDFEDPKKYRDAVRTVRGAGAGPLTIWVAPPRIFKTGEQWTLNLVRDCEADGILVRNFDHLQYFAGVRQVGDFSFNVANALSAEWLMERGLERVTASYDLNGTQLTALLREAPPEWFEVTIHQHMPMFHMEHCVFCAFLSTGTDYTNCGRPCDRHAVRLRDRVGAEHILKADVGCRNTVFNALAQSGAELVDALRAQGARYFRLEFVDESAEQVRQIVSAYQRLLRGELTGGQLWRELKLVNQLGVTRGSLEKR